MAVAVLGAPGVDVAKIRSDLLKAVKPGEPTDARGPDVPYTSRAKKVLELSMSSARELKHSHVGTEHVQLGLLREAKGTAVTHKRQWFAWLNSSRPDGANSFSVSAQTRNANFITLRVSYFMPPRRHKS